MKRPEEQMVTVASQMFSEKILKTRQNKILYKYVQCISFGLDNVKIVK
jgi:hypothetical protein